MAITETYHQMAVDYQNRYESENATFGKKTGYATIEDFDYLGGKATIVVAVHYHSPESGRIELIDLELEEFSIRFEGERGRVPGRDWGWENVWFEDDIKDKFMPCRIASIIEAAGTDEDFLYEVL